MPFGPSHRILRKIARYTLEGFLSNVEVVNSENVPVNGPLIVCCTHWNMIVDPAILSGWFPHGRMLHYWAKSTIFINAPVSALLKDAGNIPVDRKTRDNQKLFSGTFDVLRQNECVAIFPEGTSYTLPQLQSIKEGAAWAALEYEKDLAEHPEKGGRHIQIVIATIVYTKKTDYRQRAVLTFSKPVDIQEYRKAFLSAPSPPAAVDSAHDPHPITRNPPSSVHNASPETAKLAVKALTKKIRDTMESMTVNAPDWNTLRAAETARQLLWGDDDAVPLSQWQSITQTLVSLFTPDAPHSAQAQSARSSLIAYEASLRSQRFSNSSLNALPLPRILDPLHPAAAPDRFRTLWALFKATFQSALLLPFFILPLFAHLPIYVVGKSASWYFTKPTEPEDMAQNKIVFSLLVVLILVYPAVFFFTWAICLFSPIGFIIAAGWTAAFSIYHTRLVDLNYKQAKRLLAAWRVLLGIWKPQFTKDEDGKYGEGETRRMLRLRSEAANSTVDLLLQLEKSKDLQDDWVDCVRYFRQHGARIGYMGPVMETDRHGRLKQL